MENILIEGYRLKKCIGKGSTGEVYTAYDKDENIYAIKIIDRCKLSFKRQKYLKYEIKILENISHANVINFIEVIYYRQYTCIVTEYYENNNLKVYLKKNRNLELKLKKKILFQIIQAIRYLGQNKILHRDIKLENIFITTEGNAKVGDFGISKISDMNNSYCGSLIYIAPEMLTHKEYSYGVDVWSFGVLFYKVIYDDYPFKSKTTNELIAEQKGFSKFPQNATKEEKEILNRIFKIDPKERIKIEEL